MEVMDVAVKVINFIRSRAKNHQLFLLLDKKSKQTYGTFVLYRSPLAVVGKMPSLRCIEEQGATNVGSFWKGTTDH